MAATAVARTNIEVDGLTGGLESMSVRYSDTVAPRVVFKGNPVIGTAVANLNLGGIAVTDVRGVMMRAVGGTVGVLVNDVGTGVPSATVGNIVLPANGCAYIPLGGGLTTDCVIRIVGSAAAVAIEYFVYGIHT